MCISPDGEMSSELLFGQRFRILETDRDWVRGQSLRDEYGAWIKKAHLGPVATATHSVQVLSSHIYVAPSVQAKAEVFLPFGALIECTELHGDFVAIGQKQFVPLRHVGPVGEMVGDHVRIAEMFVGSPYLWGGCQATGIDCSGLVQVALLSAGHSCPRDSGPQFQTIGELIDNRPKRGDLAFWKNHVGIMVNNKTLLHANAHSMTVTMEEFLPACERIESSGNPFLGFRRL